MSDSHRPKHPFKPRFGAEETCVYCYELEDSPFHGTVEGETTMADKLHKVPEDPYRGTPPHHEFASNPDNPLFCLDCNRLGSDFVHRHHKFVPKLVKGGCVLCDQSIDNSVHMPPFTEPRAYRYEVVRKLAEKLYLMDVYGAHPEFDDADQLLQNTYVGKARALIADPDLRVELR